jgi:hypothetical protein
MSQVRVKLGFRNATNPQIKILGINVLTGMKGNPRFPDPFVDMATLEKAINEFDDAMIKQADGLRGSTAFRDKKRDELMELLRKEAAYVDSECGNDLEVLLSSGFPAWNTSRALSPMPKVVIMKVGNGMSAQLRESLRHPKCPGL